MAKPVSTAVGMMPLPESVAVPFVAPFVKDGPFLVPDFAVAGARARLDELKAWESA